MALLLAGNCVEQGEAYHAWRVSPFSTYFLSGSQARQYVEFANNQAAQRGVTDKVKFHFRNMLDTGFETGSMRSLWTNETTMYVDLFKLFAEFSRLLKDGGRYVCITGCYNDITGGRSRAVSQIDSHYICNIHPRSEYFKALAANNLVPIAVTDQTAHTIPYWELRAKSSVATGIEDSFTPTVTTLTDC